MKTRNYISTLALMAATALLTSCSTDDLATAPSDNFPQDGRMRISTSLTSAGTTVLTRADGGTTTLYTGKTLGLFVNYGYNDDGTPFPYTRVNVKWTQNGTNGWTQDTTTPDFSDLTTPMLWKDGNSSAKITAYAPYTDEKTDSEEFNKNTAVFRIPTDQREGTDEADFVMTQISSFKPATGLTDGSLNLTLEHVLHKLTVQVNLGTQYDGEDVSVADMTLHGSLAAFAMDGKFSYSTPLDMTTVDIQMHPVSSTAGGTLTFESISYLFPIAEGTKLLTLILSNGKKYTYNISKKVAIAIGFLNEDGTGNARPVPSGSAFLLNLKVGKDKLEIANGTDGNSGVTVVDWDEAGNVIPGGEASEVSSANADTHTVKLITAGTLTDDLLTKAINGGTTLVITGDMNTTDLALLKAYFKNSSTTATDIDLSNSKFTSLPTEFLSGRSAITSVKLPEGLTTIGNSAFKGCMGLTTIDLPQSITTLGYDVFYYCSKLQGEINLPNVTEIGYQCFMQCSALESIKLPNLITANGSHVFYGCSNLTEVDFPNVTSIGTDYTFADCTNLRTVNLPKVQTVTKYAFNDCKNLSEVHLDIAQTLDMYAFGKCTSLTNVAFSKVQSIGSDSFRGCTSLATVELPETATIGQTAFYGCTVLKDVTLPSATTIGSCAFQECNNLATLKLTTANAFVTSSMNDVFWTSSRPQTDLFLNSNKSSDISGNVWLGVTWKSITTTE